MLYRIEKITDTQGAERTDGRYPQRVGREGYLQMVRRGEPMAFCYAEPEVGTLVTTEVSSVVPWNRGLSVRTKHAIYYISEVEAGGPVWPEPIDREEDAV